MSKVPKNYNKEARKEAEKTIRRSPTLIEAREKGNHIGHKTSVKDCNTSGISAKNSGIRENLQIETPKENLKKGSTSTQSTAVLKNKINKKK